MKTFLIYKDKDSDPNPTLPSHSEILIYDLELETLFSAMAQNDDFIYEITKRIILTGMDNDLETIIYRQDILKDCIQNPSVIRELYQITIESVENKKRHWYGIFGDYPSSILSGSREMMQMFASLLKKLKNIADNNADKFKSDGFSKFYAMIQKELDNEYFATMETHLKELKFQNGVLISAELGKGNEGSNYVLRKPNLKQQNWLQRIITKKPPSYTFSIHPRDEAGSRALSILRNRGINRVANALAKSADHIDNFFKALRMELAFYIGCINLHEQIKKIGGHIAFPIPFDNLNRTPNKYSFKNLYDICLALTIKQRITGNDINADGKNIVIITGANQGGKSTFLRSIGLAQLMMQCGMFVPAQSFSANIINGIFTHYRKEEDHTMQSGKLDEELLRMNNIASTIKSGSMVLFNESFSATNEREGSEIARQITLALSERGIMCFFVTHLYEFPRALYDKKMKNTIFLRAQRQADGKRTFKILQGKPIQTSYGEDLYSDIFKISHSKNSEHQG